MPVLPLLRERNSIVEISVRHRVQKRTAVRDCSITFSSLAFLWMEHTVIDAKQNKLKVIYKET